MEFAISGIFLVCPGSWMRPKTFTFQSGEWAGSTARLASKGVYTARGFRATGLNDHHQHSTTAYTVHSNVTAS